MTFDPLAPRDYPGIARADRARRRQAAARAGWDRDRRAVDDADWSAIEQFDFHLVEIRAEDDRPDTPWRAERERLSAVARTVAATAVRKWYAEGQRPGEPEARAFKLWNLALRLRRCCGHPPLSFTEAIAHPQEKSA